MAIVSSFQAMGKTYKANAAATSQTLVITADGPCNQICVANHQPTGATGYPAMPALRCQHLPMAHLRML
jgi:hypothetical protein